MKRFLIVCIISLLLAGGSLFAEEATLVDFSTLIADWTPEGADEATENAATMIDFADKAGTSFSEEEKKRMKTSLAIENWEVILSSSSRTVKNQSLSYTREVQVKEDASKYAGESVLGVRIHFPNEPYNSWAIIRPPFEIPAYMRQTEVEPDGTLTPVEEDLTGSKFEGFGVVKNVGILKSVSMNLLGRNFPYGVGIIVKDHNNNERTLFMRYMDFDGWKTVTWTNTNYVEDVRNRELVKQPLYPRATPSVKLIGVMVYKDAAQIGGDFIGYFKDIQITYDKAMLDLEQDVDDEAVWGILEQRERERRNAEFQRLGELQVLRYLEKQKMHNPDAAGTENGQGTSQ